MFKQTFITAAAPIILTFFLMLSCVTNVTSILLATKKIGADMQVFGGVKNIFDQYNRTFHTIRSSQIMK